MLTPRAAGRQAFPAMEEAGRGGVSGSSGRCGAGRTVVETEEGLTAT